MILALWIGILIGAGILAWAAGGRWPNAARWICVLALGFDLCLVADYWISGPGSVVPGGDGWMTRYQVPWIPSFGIDFHLGLDGLSLLMVALSMFLGILAVGCGWREVRERVGFYHFNLMWVLAGILGVFMALDLFLFYFFWELMVIPMYFLIVIWGHENKTYAAFKFFLFTQAGGLLMLLSIIGLAYFHYQQTGVTTFDSTQLMNTALSLRTALVLMMGFFIAFAVKLPSLPFHTWLPDAHTEAPTAGSVILAGLLLKTGAYGLLRFAVPLFPEAARVFAPAAMAIGAVSIVYGSICAIGQTDLKRLVAYTSVSHLGFVLLGIYAGNQIALQGVVMQMIAHGLSSAGLFILVGLLQERIHTRDINQMGGFGAIAPKMAAAALIIAMAGMGFPGMANFLGEMLTLIGSFRASAVWTIVATAGLITATVYTLLFFQRPFHGPQSKTGMFSDLSGREVAILSSLVITLLWLGLYPKAAFDTADPALARLQARAASAAQQTTTAQATE
jgi:NADH-quinone oxidoreductase subunit M